MDGGRKIITALFTVFFALKKHYLSIIQISQLHFTESAATFDKISVIQFYLGYFIKSIIMSYKNGIPLPCP